MKRLHFAVGLFAALAGSGLRAQTVMEAHIPFEFQMGKTSFPAGDYKVEYSTRLLVVHQEQGDRSTAMAMPQQASRTKAPDTGIIEFMRYGDIFFMSKIWTPGSRDGGALPKTAHEKELARAVPPNRMEAILLQTK